MKKDPKSKFKRGDTVSFLLNYRSGDERRSKGYFIEASVKLYFVRSKTLLHFGYPFSEIPTPKSKTYSTRMVLTEKTIDLAR